MLRPSLVLQVQGEEGYAYIRCAIFGLTSTKRFAETDEPTYSEQILQYYDMDWQKLKA